ncbi:hypothetical protein IW261DRAFT_537173 [Armillaria novae-zelandiae]|uniref:Uncharacterized protein n=1 Tax=Armillaria novae-zelandiae TaxID=153914 RepID=A0AA39NZX5_9AGAR|nr:hypothetical protein IW261DRAFT_537173 [Armillaria novae-zelandiae]
MNTPYISLGGRLSPCNPPRVDALEHCVTHKGDLFYPATQTEKESTNLCLVLARHCPRGLFVGLRYSKHWPTSVVPQFEAQFGTLSRTTQRLLVPSILIAASITSLAAGPLSDHISWTHAIALGGAVFSAGCDVACSAQHRP